MKYYKPKKILKALDKLGFTLMGEPDMMSIYILKHTALNNIIMTIDKTPVPEDYMQKKIEEVMDFKTFDKAYESII